MKKRNILWRVAVWCAVWLLCSMSACSSGGDEPPVNPPVNPPVEQPTEPTEIAVAPDAWDGVKRADITYQLLVYAFADSNGDKLGDLKGIVSKLDYLQQLGVSAIWLSPVHPAASYHGYDVKDYEAINPDYGTEADFRALIEAAHARGIRIYMDWVINHTSREHPWFRAAVADEKSPYRDYYILSTDPRADIAAGRIPMIATEGAAGYDAGQWFSTATADAGSQRLKFTLDWSGAKKTLKVETVDRIENTGAEAKDKWLYFGDPASNHAFYDQGNGIYTLAVDFASPWGCLVRTSATQWDNYKWGASSDAAMQWGVPMSLANGGSAKDILLPGMEVLKYHSHFWTDWFADLNYGAAASCEQSPAFKAVCSAAEKWLDMGVDGLRMDGAKHIYHNAASDENPTFWNKFYTTLDSHFRKSHTVPLYMVGEVFSAAAEVAPYYKGLPACFEFDFWWRLESAINSATGCYFVKDILSYRTLYKSHRADFIAATKLSNHDEDRARSTLNDSEARAKLAGAVLLTASGSPYIYYGEELGYVGTKQNGDEYVRAAMKWGDGSTIDYTSKVPAGMASVKEVAAQESDPESMLNVYRRFAVVRNTYPALATGEMTPHAVYNDRNGQYKQIAAWYRTADKQRMLVVHNFSPAVSTIKLDDPIEKAVARLGTVSATVDGSTATVRLDGYSSIVFLLK